jgi:preprotein translocase subunit Sec61beta
LSKPGHRLRSLAARVCRATTMERLIDPVIADMQHEHADASRRGHVWRRAWVLVAGWLAFWRVIGALAIERSINGAYEWAAADDWAVGRTLGGSTLVTVAVTIPVALMTLMMGRTVQFRGGDTVRMILYLVPSAIPIALPSGLLVGIVYGLRGRPVTTRARRAISLVAICCASGAFAWVDRVVPEANQMFRHVASGIPYDRLARGANELTFGQLAKKIDEAVGPSLEPSRELSVTLPAPAGILRFFYHARLAISITPLIVALFALRLAVAGRRRLSLVIGILAITAYFAYYFAYDFTWLIEANHWGPVAVTGIAWIPNLVFLLGTVLLKTRSQAQPQTPGSAEADVPRSPRSG